VGTPAGSEGDSENNVGLLHSESEI